MHAHATPEALEESQNDECEAMPDHAVLAQVLRGDRIEVENLVDRTLELFQRTLQIVDCQSKDDHPSHSRRN